MIALLLPGAVAAPVICDPDAARSVVAEAAIDPVRIPETHPWLVPGLVVDDRSDGPLAEALATHCADPNQLSIARAESWKTGDWSAHTLLLTRASTEGCALVVSSLVITAGIRGDQAPRYALRSRLPDSRTPIGGCPEPAVYRREEVLEGDGGPVRLVLVTDHEGEDVVASRVVVLSATPSGWQEQVLMAPAPARLVGGHDGPRLTLHQTRTAETWIVASADRGTDDTGACVARPGQTVWRRHDTGWTPTTGRAALALLTTDAAWRLAGQEGWMLVLAQDTPQDRALLQARRERLASRSPDDPLHILDSSDFPELNAGYLIVTPDPWPDEEQARASRRRWGRRPGSYVKRAWSPPDPCATPTTEEG